VVLVADAREPQPQWGAGFQIERLPGVAAQDLVARRIGIREPPSSITGISISGGAPMT
jgi:hypothetical protein